MNFHPAAAARFNPRSATCDLPRPADMAPIGCGFFDSSMELRRGCMVTETPISMIPDELLREFSRQIAH